VVVVVVFCSLPPCNAGTSPYVATVLLLVLIKPLKLAEAYETIEKRDHKRKSAAAKLWTQLSAR
jgi:hypothetical protein